MTLASTLATTPSGTTASGDDSPGPWDDSIVLVEPWVGVEAPGDISSSDHHRGATALRSSLVEAWVGPLLLLLVCYCYCCSSSSIIISGY